MSAYKEIGRGWPESKIKSPSPSRHEVQMLVRANRWHELGVMFEFIPVFHFSGRSFLDWRCVPQSLLDVLRARPPTHKPDAPKRPAKGRFHKLYDEQNGICHYCKKKVGLGDWSVDHRLPKFRGGSNSDSNLIGACKTCNNTKSCLTEEEFFALEPTSPKIFGRARNEVARLLREMQKKLK